MNRDPEKHRAWQRRGAANYAAKQRERGRSPQKRERNAPSARPMPDGEWRPVPGWEGLYEVSSEGDVWTVRGGRLMKPNGSQVYLQVRLSGRGRREFPLVHRLVCAAFHGPPPPGMEVRHLDGDARNNRASNLAWGTVSENRQDTIAHGRHHQLVKMECPKGHPYDERNTYVNPSNGGRLCRTCRASGRAKARRNDGPWRSQCLEKRGAWCRVCGYSGRVEIDHVFPRSQGGPSVVENGLPLCPTHHQAKTESRLRFRFEWFDADQIAWLEEVGWVSWDADGQPAGRGWRHFEPLTTKQTARRAPAAGNTEGEKP